MKKILCVFILALTTLSAHAADKSNPGRFLYIVTCDAQVKKIDTVKQQQLSKVDLARKSGKQSLIPKTAGTIDGCLASSVVFDATKSVFHLIAPVQTRLKPDGTNDYNVLTYSIPDLRLVDHQSAGKNLAAAPHLDSSFKVIEDAAWASAHDLDLSGFTPDKTALPNQIIETSGDQALIRLFTDKSTELSLAVANQQNHTVTRLNQLAPTVALNAHLAPGGGMVLIEEVKDRVKSPVKNGKIGLYDAASGNKTKEISDERVKKMKFVAITPNGKAIYQLKNDYVFIDLGTTFTNNAVSHLLSNNYPEMFFADQ